MTKRPREDLAEGGSTSLSEWLTGVLKSDETAVSSFVNLRENREAMDGAEKEEQYKGWLQNLSGKHPQPVGTKAISEMSLEEGKSLVKASAMELVDDAPLVAASFMFLDGSSHTNVNEWKAEELEKSKEAKAAEGAEKAEGEVDDDKMPKKRVKSEKKPRTRDLVLSVKCDTLDVKAEANDASDTVLTLYRDETVIIDEVKVFDEVKWGVANCGFVRMQDAEGNDNLVNHHTSERVIKLSKDGSDEIFRKAAVRQYAVLLRMGGTMNTSKLGTITWATPFVPITKFDLHMRNMGRLYPELFVFGDHSLALQPDAVIPEYPGPIDLNAQGMPREECEGIKGKIKKRERRHDGDRNDMELTDQPLDRTDGICKYHMSKLGCGRGDACKHRHPGPGEITRMRRPQGRGGAIFPPQLQLLQQQQMQFPTLNPMPNVPLLNAGFMGQCNPFNQPLVNQNQSFITEETGQRALQRLLQEQRMRKQKEKMAAAPVAPVARQAGATGGSAMQALMQSMQKMPSAPYESKGGKGGKGGKGKGRRRNDGQQWN